MSSTPQPLPLCTAFSHEDATLSISFSEWLNCLAGSSVDGQLKVAACVRFPKVRPCPLALIYFSALSNLTNYQAFPRRFNLTECLSATLVLSLLQGPENELHIALVCHSLLFLCFLQIFVLLYYATDAQYHVSPDWFLFSPEY